MKIIRKPLKLDSKVFSADFGKSRSPGCHLMEIVEDIAQKGGIEKVHDDSLLPYLDTFAVLGFVWEHVIEKELNIRVIEEVFAEEMRNVYFSHHPEIARPGELMWCKQCDEVMLGGGIGQDHLAGRKHTGIYGTPDGVNLTLNHLEEFKCTWKSSRRAGGDNTPDAGHVAEGIWRWPVQSMSYCYMMDLDRSMLRGFFVNGEYGTEVVEVKNGKEQTKRLFIPEAWSYDMAFTPHEMSRNWSQLVDRATRMGWI